MGTHIRRVGAGVGVGVGAGVGVGSGLSLTVRLFTGRIGTLLPSLLIASISDNEIVDNVLSASGFTFFV